MTKYQHPLGSGFTAASTASDVAEGIDLTGRNVVITAGHVGLGLEVTRTLSTAGATITVGARDPKQAVKALAGIQGVEVAALDLIDPTSVDAFATQYLASNQPLHILINNAGIMGGGLVRDHRGYEQQFSINHLGHFQLANRLLPALREAHGARVVAVSSWGHHLSDIRWNDLHFVTDEYHEMVAYGQSKTANVLFAVELDRRWSGEGIRVRCAPRQHRLDQPRTIDPPGRSPHAGLSRRGGQADRRSRARFQDTQQGAATTVFASTTPLLADIGGVYLQDSDIAPIDETILEGDHKMPTGPIEFTVGVTPYAVDPDSAQRLWDLSAQAL